MIGGDLSTDEKLPARLNFREALSRALVESQ